MSAYKSLQNAGLANNLFEFAQVVSSQILVLQKRCYSLSCNETANSFSLKTTHKDNCPDCNHALFFKRVAVSERQEAA